MEDVNGVKDVTAVKLKCADCGGPLFDITFILPNGDRICPSCLYKTPDEKHE